MSVKMRGVLGGRVDHIGQAISSHEVTDAGASIVVARGRIDNVLMGTLCPMGTA